LGGQVGRECRSHSGSDRVDAHSGVLRSHGLSLSTTAMVARRIAKKIRKARRLRRAGDRPRLFVSLAVGVPCFFYAPNLLRLMALPGDRCDRQRLHQNLSGWKFRRAAALSQQCNFRGRRCGHRHAPALGIKHHQSRARSLPDFWMGTVSSPRRYRRGFSYAHRAQHRSLYQFYRLMRGPSGFASSEASTF